MTDIYIGVGSNTDPTTHIAQALARMQAKLGPLNISETYRNAAVGFAGEDFLNLVVGFQSDHDLATVVRDLLEIELLVGKDFSTPKLSSQIIDLDLLLFGDLVLRTDRLEIPRPETLTESYCLKPLAELCPDRVHPTAGKTFAALSRAHDGHALERFDWRCALGDVVGEPNGIPNGFVGVGATPAGAAGAAGAGPPPGIPPGTRSSAPGSGGRRAVFPAAVAPPRVWVRCPRPSA